MPLGVVAVGLILGCQAIAPPAPAAAPDSMVTTIPRIVEWEAVDSASYAPETLPAGPVTIRLANHRVEPRLGQLMRLNPGVSFEQFAAALQSEGDGAIQFVSLEGRPGAIDPQGTGEVSLDLRPGNYVLACFVASPQGVPHLASGMLRSIQVPASDLAHLHLE